MTLIESDGADAYEAALRQTIDEADDLIKTFNALLSIAQIEAGALRDEMSVIDAGALARDIVELYEPAAEQAQVALTASIDADLFVRGNRELISQALANLLDNAIKYAGAGGKVHVEARADGAIAALCISDTGPGIAAADRERVVQRFVRLEDSRTAPGAGLGLSLVAAVTRLHEGALELADADDGRGLKACLFFPLDRER